MDARHLSAMIAWAVLLLIIPCPVITYINNSKSGLVVTFCDKLQKIVLLQITNNNPDV